VRIMLTGGFGYLGSRLAQTLAAGSNYEVIAATRRALPPPPPAHGVKGITLDWSSESSLSRACEGIDTIVHLAGMGAADCAADPVAALEFKGAATARLVQAAVQQHVQRFIYVSTAHVYGAALRGTVSESTCPQPTHPYATSHRAAEDIVRIAHRATSIQGIVMRLSNCFGAPADPGAACWSLLINDVCLQAVRAHRVFLKTSGHQRRDFVALSEACEAIRHMASVPASSLGDGVFNVGSGWAPTALEAAEVVADRVESVLGFRPEIRPGTTIDRVGGGHLNFTVQRLIETGFEPRREAICEEMNSLIAFCVRHKEMISA
jgi:UDP-glucose 4-epimerase